MLADHLLLGAADIHAGMDWVERRTGVRAVQGGIHPGLGTQNALLSLGNRQYLEIVAPDPAQTIYSFPIDVRKFTEPRLITWAAVTTGIDALAKRALKIGHQIFGPCDGSRARPDGSVLKWKTLWVRNTLGFGGVEPIPFFIEWALDALHPSQDSPPGCVLQSFDLEHPEPLRVKNLMRGLGIEAEVRPAEHIRLKAVLKTPKGKVEFG